MNRSITDLESIIDPIATIFRRARATDNLDVPAPNNMIFGEDSSITLVWNLTSLPAMDAVLSFDKIKTLAVADFVSNSHNDVGIVTYTSSIKWHGDHPDVYFRVVLPSEVTKCPNLIGSPSVSS